MASSAQATNLAAGATVTPTVLSNLTGYITGSAIADTGIVAYNTVSGSIVEKGSYEARVYKDATAGWLDFVYDFNEITSSSTAIASATIGVWTGFGADVYYVSSSPLAGTVVSYTSPAADTAQRSAAGDSVKFLFNTAGVGVGQSAEMLVRVQATNVIPGTYSLQNTIVSQLSGFEPTNTPEPASYAMIGAGLLALGYFRRKSA